MAFWESLSPLARAEFVTFALTAASALLAAIAAITPSWQVAEDLDAHRSVRSGLWIYCTEGMQCWYIFSDTLINYYERVDVCRFLLIYDCRKKLLRTPYFFGWHYAVLVLMAVMLLFNAGALVALGVGHFRRRYARLAIVALDICLFMAFLLLCIALAVFMINAEMLESRYLIGIKNTFEKSYGGSFYLACLSLTVLIFAVMGAVLITALAFFMNGLERDYYATQAAKGGAGGYDPGLDLDLDSTSRKYQMMQEAPPAGMLPGGLAGHGAAVSPSLLDASSGPGSRYCYSPDMAIPTRTFLSY